MVLFYQLLYLLFLSLPSQREGDRVMPTLHQYCAQDALWKLHPALKQRQADLDSQARKLLSDPLFQTTETALADHTLPVVVHIIHNNGVENISDATVLQGIQHLNDAYANVGYYNPNTGVDTKIQFCLARRDPNGNATNGITRNLSALTDMTLETDDIMVKDLNRWDPTHYINIWLVKEICSSSAGCGVAGYAYFPSSHGNPEDGIMMEAAWFGSDPGSSSVIVHEMGHYLGVYHTFEGGCSNNDCLADGDQVCDTPPDQSTAAVPCNSSMNSCSTDANSGFASDQDDMFWNYMDYGDWNCYSAFTQGQVDRMHFTIENPRVSLKGSLACLDPCNSPLIASFTASNITLAVGGIVNFTNNSSNATSAQWQVDGATFSNNTNSSYTFNQVGFFEICLTVANADPNCFDDTCQTIQVTCPIVPQFVTDNFYPMPGQVVNYTNQSQNATTYQWHVDGIVQSSGTNFNISFPAVGVYEVCLVADNGLCEAEYCLPVFVSEEPPPQGECDTSFVKIFGNLGVQESVRSICAAPNGGFFFAGRSGDQSMISLLDSNNNLLWARQFAPNPSADDYVLKIILDSDNFIIGVGLSYEANQNSEAFVFKYDWQNDLVVWSNELDIADPAGEGYFDVLEKAPNGNYVVVGQLTPPGFPNEQSHLLIEVNRTTGLIDFAKTFEDASQSYKTWANRIVVFGNSIYTLDMFWSNAKNTGAISRFDLNGGQLWTKQYLHDINLGIIYDFRATDLLADNGLICYGWGISTDYPDGQFYLFKTDENGILDWAKRYQLPNGENGGTTKLINLPDGYLGLINVVFPSEDAIIFKSNKQGNIQWCKRFGSIASEYAVDVIWQNGQIHIIGNTDGTDPDGDIFIVSLTHDGLPIFSDSCGLFTDFALIESDWANPFEGPFNLTETSFNANTLIGTKIIQHLPLQKQLLCPISCTDSCDFRPDAVIESVNAQCNGDSLTVNLFICNIGNFELPQGTFVSFYSGDPTAGAAPLIGQHVLPQKIKKDSCFTLSVNIPAAPMPIFIVVNDQGTFPQPINLVDPGPNTDIIECDYTNNIGSFDISYTPPPLELGPDILMCENGIAVLDAGPDFYSYRWQDGSDAQTFTAFFPGTYSVTVTDICGGTQTDQVNISVDPASILDLGSDTLICLDDTLVLSVNDFDRFQWFPNWRFECDTCQTQSIVPQADSLIEIIAVGGTDLGCYSVDTILVGVTEPVFTFDTLYFCPGDTVFLYNEPVTEPGEYAAVFPREAGCDSTHTIFLNSLGNLFVALPADLTIQLGDSIRLNPITNGVDLLWQWSPSESLNCDDCPRPWARPFSTKLYTLIVTDANGCDAKDELLITVLLNRQIYIPNAFSPNGDGINDEFMIYAGGNVKGVREFLLFDRWGEKVFEDYDFLPNDPTHGWNGVFKGKSMDPAVFVFKAEIEYVDGEVEVFYGDATLVR